MKRLVLFVSLVLLLALGACVQQPETQEVLPGEATAAIGETAATATPLLEAPPEGEVIGGNIIPTLTGTTWEWVDTTTPTETIVAVDPARYTITFNEDGTAAIMADCNSMSATYMADETGAISIVPGASTMMACPEDTQDQLFVAALANAANYFAIDTGNDLYIDQAADAGTMRFRVGGAAEAETEGEGQLPTTLTGTTWEWVSVIDPMGQTVSADPTRYTIIFNDDGTANITADCNSVMANYASDGNTLTIMPGATTLVACEPGSQDQLFVSSLSSAASYTVQDGELFIEMDSEAGTVMFRAAGTGATTEGEPMSAPPLTGTTWQWAETMTPSTATAIADPTRYTIAFNDDGTVNIKADCNTVLGTYTTADDGSLTITLGPSTMVACPEDSQGLAFTTGLALVSNYSFDGDVLVLHQPGDVEMYRFNPAAAAEGETEAGGAGEATEMSLTGTTWQWVETTTPTETVTVADPTRYTIMFNEDGTATVKADCNQVTATYTVTDSALTIVPGASTMAMCPEDSQATAFVAGLSSAAIYFFQDGHLFIDQFASAGTLKLAPATTAEEPGKGQTTEPTTPTMPTTGELVGPVWQLTGITKVDGNITINDPTRYTISFNADGTANLVTDCNVGGAAYTTGEGNTLTITPGVSTMAYCGPGSFDQIFLGGLTNAMSYRMEGGNLLIDMLYESGTLTFISAQQ